MGRKVAKVEKTEIMSQSAIKPLVWKRYIDDIFFLWYTSREEITQCIERANKHHPTIKFMAKRILNNFLGHHHLQRRKINTKQNQFLMCEPTSILQRHFNLVLSSTRFQKERLYDFWGQTLLKPTLFEEKIENFKTHLSERGYPKEFIERNLELSELKSFQDRSQALQQKRKKIWTNLAVSETQYHPMGQT